MKKLILILLLFAVPSYAFNPLQVCTGAVVSAGCNDEIKDSESSATISSITLGEFTNSTYIAVRFQAGSSYTLCKISMKMKEVGSSTGNIVMYIYSETAGPKPDSNLSGSGSNPVDSSSIGTTETDVIFDGFSVPLTSGDYYWMVCYKASNDSSNYVEISKGSYNVSKYVDRSTDGTTWILAANNIIGFTSYN